MFPILQVGPLAIQTPGLILILGLWLGISLAEKFSNQRKLSPATLYNLIFTTLAAGIVGGRILYALRYPAAFTGSPWSLLSINPGLFKLEDGILIGGLAAWIYGYRKRLPLWNTLDAITPTLAALSVAFGLSHLASGAAFGAPTGLPWGIPLWGETRHPSQVYETILALGILVLLWPSRSRFRNWLDGRYFLTFIALTAASQLFLEAFRGDSRLILSGFRSAQIISWLVLLASLFALHHLSKEHRPSEQD